MSKLPEQRPDQRFQPRSEPREDNLRKASKPAPHESQERQLVVSNDSDNADAGFSTKPARQRPLLGCVGFPATDEEWDHIVNSTFGSLPNPGSEEVDR